jgi:hypothetical protein
MDSARVIRAPRAQRLCDGSPGLIAVFHALHRLLAPRHPPHALSSLAAPTPCSRPTLARRHGLPRPGVPAARPDTPGTGQRAESNAPALSQAHAEIHGMPTRRPGPKGPTRHAARRDATLTATVLSKNRKPGCSPPQSDSSNNHFQRGETRFPGKGSPPLEPLLVGRKVFATNVLDSGSLVRTRKLVNPFFQFFHDCKFLA